MGAPKQKWTSDEEAALKAGVAKYGVGKWSTILKDSEFSHVLRSRSNVDLKDKWRNLHVMASGWGSRQRGKIVPKSVQPTPVHGNNMLVTSTVENDAEVLDAKPLASSDDTPKLVGSKIPISRLDDHILEAIIKLKEPRGSSRNAISSYIEERYIAPPNFERLMSVNLKTMTEKGRLMKVKHHYRIATTRVSSDVGRDLVPLPIAENHDPTVVDKNGMRKLTKAQVEADLEKIMSMTPEAAAEAAARAVAEAEAAIAEAAMAAQIAEAAEAEAEAARCFYEVASKELQHQTVPHLMA